MRCTLCLLASILLFIPFSGYAQPNSFPEGVYLNVEQLRNRTPAFNIPLRILPKSKSKYKTANFYKLASDIDSINERYTKFKILAYSRGDSLLINSLNNSKYSFGLALTKGSFLVFPMKTKQMDGGLIASAAMFGLIGAMAYTAMSSSQDHSSSKPQYGNLMILSLRTGNYRVLTREYVAARLKELPQVLEQFKKERKRMSLEVLLEYVDILNEKLTVRPIE